MGSGAARELEEATELPEMDEELSRKLGAALTKLDAIDMEFRTGRRDERNSQLVKIWGAACKEIDRHLLTLSNVLNETHQVSLEPGSTGGGRQITPWVEESTGRFSRLTIRLNEEVVECSTDAGMIARAKLDDVSYAWLERVIVKWLILGVKAKL